MARKSSPPESYARRLSPSCVFAVRNRTGAVEYDRGRVVPVRTIYETVWHETYMPASNNTVMVHIVNLRKKLEEDPANPRLIRTVWGKGYQID